MSTDSLVRSSYKSELDTIKPGSSANMKFHYFAGPKKISLLKSSGKLIGNEINLDDAVSFGWFDIIAKPCLYVMNFIYDNVFSNYGVAIIILTIIIKLCFWPLATKSYKSMAEMKKLQPVIAELKEKYKGDSKKMNQEMMNLYKIYKVNPFSGCFPLIVQMPIFIALYRMLYSAVELRHAPFAAWITDLSAPERLFNFGISIPFMEPPIGIPVLTIIMGFTMFLQQKMSPPAGDPAQARIMMLMPLFLMVVFINFSSGLVLYWLVNNVLSIAQQYYINKKLA
jgi:YidC/Oxa1 family membrane protein insertase